MVDRATKFREARFGLFIHWGTYSVAGFEASWPLVRGTIGWDDYHALADRFNPAAYDPVAWAALAKATGVRYAVLTSKHHDGFAMFDTKLSDYSSVQRAAGRDLVRGYVDAFRAAGILVGFYFSLSDWHHPDYPIEIVEPQQRHWRPPSGQTPNAPRSIASDPARWERYLAFTHGQVRELCENYGEIDLFWFDGDWEHTAAEWRSAELVAMIRALQPGAIVNNRLGGFGSFDPGLGDYGTPELFVPVDPPETPWETCLTINETWAYNPHDRAYKSSRELVTTLAEVASKGGNLLLNVGPTPEGTIPPEFSSRLRTIGHWLEGNREAIFAQGWGLAPGAFYGGPTTGSDAAVYLHVLGRPGGEEVIVRGLGRRRVVAASILATGAPLEFDQHRGELEQGVLRVRLPDAYHDPLMTVVKLTTAEE
ncbi:MAG TPA: alpha-L-fucosidase [Thermomicrobiales bacterium]|jgi:alpha-L-fucosidase